MSDTTHRSRHEAAPSEIEVRDVDVAEDGDWFAIRMPISSTATARDGEAFTRDRLEGWTRQIEAGTVPIFADHGRNDDVAESRYSAFGKFGYYANPELATREDATDLVVDNVLLDPASVPDEAAEYRQYLAILKAQAEAGMPLTASVGWSEDTDERDVPGDADLLEGSFVGIPSDARADATAGASAPALARAVDVAADGFDVSRFLDALRQRQAEDVDTVQVPAYEEVANPDGVSWDGHDLEDFEAVVEDPQPTDAVVYEKFAYSETGFPPEEGADFDSLGYPLVDVDGTLLWPAVADAAEVHPRGLDGDEPSAMAAVLVELAETEFPDEDLPDLDGDGGDTENSTDATDTMTTPDTDRAPDDVTFQDLAEFVASHPEGADPQDVTALTDQFEYVGAVDIPELATLVGNVVDESTGEVQDALEDMMSDDTDDTGEDDAGTTDEDRDGMDAQEFRESMLEMQREQTELLQTLASDMDGDDEDDDGDDDEGGENAADADGEERTVTLDGEETTVDEALAELRAQTDADPADAQTTDRAATSESDADDEDGDGDETETTDDSAGFGFAGME